MDRDASKRNRKLRKLIIDEKKRKRYNKIVSVENMQTKVTSPHQQKKKLQPPYKSQRTLKAKDLNIISNENQNPSPSLQKRSENIRFLSSNSSLNVRSPLSNISNSSFPPINTNITPVSNNIHQSPIWSSIASTNRSTIMQPSSSYKLTSGTHRLKRKSAKISPIPVINLSLDEDTDDEENYLNIMTGISRDYIDHGDQNVVCGVCHAKLWKAESVRGKKKPDNSFSLCCGGGKVELPDLKEPPTSYKSLFCSRDSDGKLFIENIRRYNSMFSFTSLGGKVDKSVIGGRGPYTFRISGENYHRLGSLLPPNGSKPKFSQLYIYDTDNEIANRQQVFSGPEKSSTSHSSLPDVDMIRFLKGILDENNVLVQSYRMVRDCFHANPEIEVKLRLIGRREKDGRTYNTPTTSEVAALIVGDIDESLNDRDIMVETSSGTLKRINELHPSYLALQYPLLFPYGDDGYMVGILHRGVNEENKSKRTTTTMREFFAFRFQDRVNTFSLIHNARRLFQQFLVDAYTMVESERLFYIRSQQTNLRCSTFENIRSQKDNGSTSTSNIGQRMILPSSFTGSARYMHQNYLDAMTLCKWFGYPDFFITVTCNPNWPEIKRFLKDTSLKAEDRPDILCRLFKIKLDALIKYLKEKALFGKVQAVVYTIEFQKRGLPHSHICLFIHSHDKLHTIEDIDRYISAEIPKRDEDPDLYILVKEFMMHGPCGPDNPKCPCMVDNKCSKNFPKQFSNHNAVDDQGYPKYKRRDNGCFIKRRRGVILDNRFVVPYNKDLLRKFQAHINVEWCNQAGSIKYLFKYINKGPDRATVAVVQSNNQAEINDSVDEVKKYFDCRYVSACEAAWRIFAYDVHYRSPSVVRLPFHLPDKQHVVYGAEDDIDYVLNKPSVSTSMFLEWMNANASYPTARQLTYVEFPTMFVWHPKDRYWEPRKSGFSIGRVHDVDPKTGEAYFLRILLNRVKGPRSFQEIRTVDGQLYSTFKDACYALGLLDDDKEYIEAIKEASISGSGFYLRNLFSEMLMSGSLGRPEVVWKSTWEYLSDGILYNLRRTSPDTTLTNDQLQNLTLSEIESILLRNNSTLKDFHTMPYPDYHVVSTSQNRLISEELSYDTACLQNEFQTLIGSLTDEQRGVFNAIFHATQSKQGGSFFVYGYGGTGKTHLWKTLSTSVRSKGQIVLNVASSGIASLLLTGGRTAHSRFHIPINLNENSMCFIHPNTDESRLLKEASLIIWDEAPMVHKHAFEALDRTLRDVLTCDGVANSELPFGGKVVVFGGDFRQILPVIKNGSRHQIVNASLCSSYLWDQCKVMQLTKNMRLTVGSDASQIEKTRLFAQWLLDIGEGKVGGSNHGDAVIEIPDDLLIPHSSDPIGSLIDFVYPLLLENKNNPIYFQQRAILAPKNKVVHDINDRLLSFFPGEEKEYLSSDSVCDTESLSAAFDKHLYSPDYLHGLKVSGLPKHRLVLKVGVPVMLLRNIDQKHGLCNGTRLQVRSLGKHVIEAVVITGSNVGHRTFISRSSLTPSDSKEVAFKFKRRQFPLSVCFAMTINKSQGQSLSTVGLFLEKPVFTHGQLYVALSRVTSRDGLKLLILDKDGTPTNKTSNVVYKEVFDMLFP